MSVRACVSVCAPNKINNIHNDIVFVHFTLSLVSMYWILIVSNPEMETSDTKKVCRHGNRKNALTYSNEYIF